MDRTESAAELRIRIAKYRAMARLTTDQETARRIHDLADELEAKVRQIQAAAAELSRRPETGR
jgi:uncharacterized protein YhaN